MARSLRTPSLFDARARLDGLPDSELANLSYFGTRWALSVAHDAYPGAGSEGLWAHLEGLSGGLGARLKAAGIQPRVALGVHPGRIPWEGLETVLDLLPQWLRRPGVVAVGEVGLRSGSAREREVLVAQLALAVAARLPVLVSAPSSLAQSLRALIEGAGLTPGRVLWCGRDEAPRRAALEAGFALLVSRPGELEGPGLRRAGQLIFGSGHGLEVSDPLAGRRLDEALEGRGVGERARADILSQNALRFFGEGPEAGPGAVG